MYTFAHSENDSVNCIFIIQTLFVMASLQEADEMKGWLGSCESRWVYSKCPEMKTKRPIKERERSVRNEPSEFESSGS